MEERRARTAEERRGRGRRKEGPFVVSDERQEVGSDARTPRTASLPDARRVQTGGEGEKGNEWKRSGRGKGW